MLPMKYRQHSITPIVYTVYMGEVVCGQYNFLYIKKSNDFATASSKQHCFY